MRMRRFKVGEKEVGLYHCMSRIVGGRFWLDDGAKEAFRKQMWKVARFCGIEVLTYCTLNNHFHVLVRVPVKTSIEVNELVERVYALYGSGPLSKGRAMERILREGGERGKVLKRALEVRMGDVSMFMKEFKQRYTIWYNKNRENYGTIWCERFRSVLVEDRQEALRIVAAYIDLNPVRAGLCNDPKDYRWCGYAEAMGGGLEARKGLGKIVGEKGAGVEGLRKRKGGDRWKEIVCTYREVLCQRVEARGAGEEGRREKVLKKLRGGLEVSMEEMLSCKIKYLTHGAILGSKAFLECWYATNRDNLPYIRSPRGCKLDGEAWRGLEVFRNPRGDSFL